MPPVERPKWGDPGSHHLHGFAAGLCVQPTISPPNPPFEVGGVERVQLSRFREVKIFFPKSIS